MTVSVIIVARAVCIGDEVAKAGDRVKVDPLIAGDLVDCGRAELCDQRDVVVIAEARASELRRVMKLAGPLQRMQGSPWQLH